MRTLREIYAGRRRPTLVRMDKSGELALILEDAHAGIVNIWVKIAGLNVGMTTHASADARAEELETDLPRILAALPMTPVLKARLERELQ